MAHEVERMVYKGAAPWHNTNAAKITPGMSLDDMLIAAGLNQTQESLIPYFLIDGKYLSPEEMNPDNKAWRGIVRQSDRYIHNMMSAEYKPIQDRVVVDFLRKFVEEGNMEMETLGSLRHGSIIWVLAKIPAKFSLVGSDRSDTYLLLVSSHDGSMEFMGWFTSIRVVCMNTMRMALSNKRGRSFSIGHSTELTADVIKSAKQQIGLAVEATEKYGEIAEKMAATHVTTRDRMEYVAKLVQPSLLAQVTENTTSLLNTIVEKQIGQKDFDRKGRDILLSIAEGPGADMESSRDTVWGLLNGVTNFVDHVSGRSRDTALTSAWFGAGEKLKADAFELAVNLVKQAN